MERSVGASCGSAPHSPAAHQQRLMARGPAPSARPRRVVAEALTGVLQDFRPDLVLYDAGVDIHQGDTLGRLAVTDDGLRRRELLVRVRVDRGHPLAVCCT